ncbi:hypothetical protein [Nocardioides marmoraquaticus]
MSAPVLGRTLVVRHPDTDAATALVEGQPVPDWAAELVHPDDLLTPDEPDSEKSGSDESSSGEPGHGASDNAGQAVMAAIKAAAIEPDVVAAELQRLVDAEVAQRLDEEFERRVADEVDRRQAETDNAAGDEVDEPAAVPDSSGSDPGTQDGDPKVALYDPGDHGVKGPDGVLAYLQGADDVERARVIAAEVAGKNRTTIVEFQPEPTD